MERHEKETEIGEKEDAATTAGDLDNVVVQWWWCDIDFDLEWKRPGGHRERPAGVRLQMRAEVQNTPFLASGASNAGHGASLPANVRLLPANGRALAANGVVLPANGGPLPANRMAWAANGLSLATNRSASVANSNLVAANGCAEPANGMALVADTTALAADAMARIGSTEFRPTTGRVFRCQSQSTQNPKP